MQQKTVSKYTKEQTCEFAKEVLFRHYGSRATQIKYIGGGSFGYVYKAELPVMPYILTVKACRVAGMQHNESAALKKLAERSLVHIPKVYFTFDATDEIPMDFIIEEFVNGTDCFTDFSKLFLSKKRKAKFADAIADCLANWHSVTCNKFGSLDFPEYDNWLDFYRPFAQDILQTAAELNRKKRLKDSALNVMQTAWKNFDYIFSEPVKEASLIHGDLNVMNVMSDKRLNITAIIDPLECKWADKEFDLFQLRNLTGECFGLYEAYKRKYPVSEKCDLKCAFYAVYHEVYCLISTGTNTEIILAAAVKRLKRELKKAGITS